MRHDYIEVRPFRHGDAPEGAASQRKDRWLQDTEPVLLKLDTVTFIDNAGVTADGSADLRSVTAGSRTLTVSAEDAAEIRGRLLGDGDGLEREVRCLASAVRDLRALLRARMR